MNDMFVPFASTVLQKAASMHSLYDGSPSSYRKLLFFMNQNQWFQLNHQCAGDDIVVSAFPDPFPSLERWLAAFLQPPDLQCNVLLTCFEERFPEASAQFKSFIAAGEGNATDHVICLDYLFSTLTEDQTAWSDEQTEQILSGAADILPRKAFLILLRFCCRMSKTETRYRLSPSTVRRPTDAYSSRNFARMAWLIFDDEAVKNGHYLEKAASDQRMAEVWFLTAMCFLCALRIPDIRSLPVPEIQKDGVSLRSDILSGEFGNSEATELVTRWLFRIETENRVPRKTQRYSGISSLVVSVPTSLFPVLGKILALIASFHEAGMPLTSKDYVAGSQLERFFGSEFLELSGGAYFFSTRRCTKSYLQGVSDMVDASGTVHITGYLAAAILRSHKLSEGQMSESTDNYLRDRSFTGLSPETVAAEMFERGVFGFIPTLLLNQLNPDWGILDIHEQTELIQALGLTSAQLEHVTAGLSEVKTRTYAQLSTLFKDGFTEEKLKRLLSDICTGMAPGKSEHCGCLRAAAGLPCMDPVRSTCIGCGCELWSRTGIHMMLSSYEHNKRQMRTAGEVEKARLNKINEQVILPVLFGILENLSLQSYSHETANDLINMITRRINNAECEEA